MEYKLFHQIMIIDDDTVLDVEERTRKTKQFLNGYEYRLWDKQSIIDLMESNNDYECLEAFNKLKPYSFKADLAKFYILNKFGGWYSDINNIQLLNLPILDDVDMVVFRERLEKTETSWAIVCGYIYSTPNNPVLDHAIKSVIYNTKNNFYGKHALYPTGPSLFGMSLAYASFYEPLNIMYGDFVDHKNITLFNLKDDPIAMYKRYNPGNANHAGTNSYVDMWFNNDIYNL